MGQRVDKAYLRAGVTQGVVGERVEAEGEGRRALDDGLQVGHRLWLLQQAPLLVAEVLGRLLSHCSQALRCQCLLFVLTDAGLL